MMRLLLFFISFAMLVASLMSVLEYWQYDEVVQDVAQLMRGEVTATHLDARIEEAIAADNPEDARMYLGIARTFGYPLNAQRYQSRIEALETPLQVARRQTGRFVSGFLEGEAESGAGVAGAVTADFTVIGDVRDLKEQYDLYSQGDDVSELIVTLAGVGVGLTAATVVSAGTAAPAKSGVSALKIAGRTGKLTPKLQRLLIRQGKDVFDHKAFLTAVRGERNLEKLRRAAVGAYNPRAMKALGETAEQVNAVRKATSLATTVDLLRYVESADDLRRLEKVSLKYGMQTKGIMKLLGKGAIGTVRVLRRGAELVVSLLATALSLLATLWLLGSRRR